MNARLEEQLKELIKEAERVGAPAMHTVLNLLLAAHQNGNHHKFAKHCCNFSPFGRVNLSAQIADEPPMRTMADHEEFDADSWGWNTSKYSH